jgi:hypothetical protein
MRRGTCESFGPDKALVGLWLLLSAIPVPIALFDVSLGHPDAFKVLAASLVSPAAVLVFVARFRATFTSERFIYRRWGATIEVAYDDLAHIEVTNVTRIQKTPVGAFLVTRDGRRLPFWPKLFPSRAVTRFFQLAPRRG